MDNVMAKGLDGLLGMQPPRIADRGSLPRLKPPRQNWILSPLQDALLIVAAPPIVLGLTLAAFFLLPAPQATALVLGVHVVFTVAHHMPTFLRIYGDVELLRRFKWTVLLAPVVPLCFSFGVLAYINLEGYPTECFLYMYLMLALWDPWHFLRQHYGFMRIYDRHNAAPRTLASRMDLMLCVSAFVYIMLASGTWVPQMLADLYNSAHLPVLMAVSAQILGDLTRLAGLATLVAGTVYGAYLYWCWRQHHFVSIAKLALLVSTFPVMYVAYTPNAWILSVVPQWTFKVGFACVGIVHMTQYLGIVWRYNRNLALRCDRARGGWFRNLHVRGGWFVGVGYVVLCLLYGDLITTRYDSRWLMSVLLAIGFTSTLLHYYFDGFIWKVRHRQNDENLAAQPPLSTDRGVQSAANAAGSWWHGARICSAPEALLRHVLYFGVPMAVLTSGALSVMSHRGEHSVSHMFQAQRLGEQGRSREAHDEARLALVAMEKELPYARRLADLQPTSAHDAELAFLIYNHSRYAHEVMPALDGREVGANEAALYLSGIEEAVRILRRGVSRGDSLAHTGREQMSSEDGARVLASWQRTANRLEASIEHREQLR
jgi:hypothetical protein